MGHSSVLHPIPYLRFLTRLNFQKMIEKRFFTVSRFSVSGNQVKIDKGIARVDLDNDKTDEYFRECYGRESLSLSVWKGKPLIGKRMWYGYFGFNWDTGTETCKRKDLEGI